VRVEVTERASTAGRTHQDLQNDSTEAHDRGDEFAGYRTIASFDEDVLASQKEPRIEVFSRQSDGSWALRIHGPGERAALFAIGCTLEIDRVYTDVSLPFHWFLGALAPPRARARRPSFDAA
jgi:hypothetical protein